MSKKELTYNEFIEGIINSRGQWNIPEGEYYEAHHIIPRCMGGLPNNKKHIHKLKHENIIWLYPQEHFIAHKMLAQEHPEYPGLILAWRWVCSTSDNNNNISSSEYAELRIKFSNLMKELNSGENSYVKKYQSGKNSPNYGIPRSEETKMKISKTLRSMNRHISRSEESKQKQSKTRKERYKLNLISGGRPKRKVKCIETGIVYNSIAEAEKVIKSTKVGECCCGKRKTAGGYHWEYYEG